MRNALGLLLWTVSVARVAGAQQVETGFLNRTVVADGASYGYQVYVPRSYDPASTWPVVLFLHGAGERGADGLVQTEVGLGEAIRRFPDRYPAVVVFPQAPEETLWQDASAEMALAALDQTMREFAIDDRRQYLTGLSMGGNGSWYLSYHYGERFAAVAPICGWVGSFGRLGAFVPDTDEPHAAVAARIGATPVWIFHGETDGVVPVAESRAMAEALRDAGGVVTYSEIPGTGHNSWDAAYASPGFAEWLFAQRRP